MPLTSASHTFPRSSTNRALTWTQSRIPQQKDPLALRYWSIQWPCLAHRSAGSTRSVPTSNMRLMVCPQWYGETRTRLPCLGNLILQEANDLVEGTVWRYRMLGYILTISSEGVNFRPFILDLHQLVYRFEELLYAKRLLEGVLDT